MIIGDRHPLYKLLIRAHHVPCRGIIKKASLQQLKFAALGSTKRILTNDALKALPVRINIFSYRIFLSE
jgi:hypothetical protein